MRLCFLMVAGVLAAALPVAADSIPATSVTSPVPKLGVFASNSSPELLLDIEARDVPVADIIEAIAEKGNLSVAIVEKLSTQPITISQQQRQPHIALQQVLQAANVNWKMVGDCWMIGRSGGTSPAPIDQGVYTFKDVDVVELLNLMSKQFGVSFIIAGDVEGRIPLIRLNSNNPEYAVKVLTDITGNKYHVEVDGTYLITAKDNTQPGEEQPVPTASP